MDGVRWSLAFVLLTGCATAEEREGTANTLGSAGGTDTADVETTGISASASASTSASASGTGTSADPSTTGPGDSSAEDDTSTTDPDCPGVCVPNVPPGWNGPVVVETGAEPGPCAAPYGVEAAVFGSAFEDGGGSCDCSCDAAGVECASSVEFYVWDELADCTGAPDVTLTIDLTVCSSLGTLVGGSWPPAITDDSGPTDPLSNDYLGMGPVGIVGGSCSATVQDTIGEASFGTTERLCAPSDSPVSCSIGGLCVPQTTSEGGACVWRMGEFGCPNEYPNGRVVHTDFEDDRSCGVCDCGSPQGSCDGASMSIREIDDGDCVSLFTITPGNCDPTNNEDVETVTFNPGAPTVSCSGPGVSMLDGTAGPTNPATICCG